jgi:nucleotide-binding universal stress UspA family protein
MASHRVLTVGVDGSETSSTALAWAAREADRRDAVLRAVHSYAIPVTGGDFAGSVMYPAVDIEELRSSYVRSVEAQLAPIRSEFPNLSIETHVEVGWPTTMLVDASKDAEMVVAGSHGTGSLAALFLGSVAHHIAHAATCAAVLVPHGTVGPTIRHVVVGTDGSPAADEALRWARHEAALWGAKLSVVHAWDYPYLEVGMPSQMKADAEAVLTKAAAMLEQAGETPVFVETELIQGAAAMTLIGASSTADLLVVGARGRGVIRSALLGSTSSYAIHHARCPVAVVHVTKS